MALRLIRINCGCTRITECYRCNGNGWYERWVEIYEPNTTEEKRYTESGGMTGKNPTTGKRTTNGF